MTAPDLSPAEQAVIDRFDAAPTPPEVVVETVARALWAEAQATAFMTVDPTERSREERFRRLAAAAIAALPPSPAEQAVKRVEALAEEFDSATLPPLINDFDRGLVAGYARAAARIRAALTSPAPAPQGEPDIGDTCCGRCPGSSCYVDQVTGA